MRRDKLQHSDGRAQLTDLVLNSGLFDPAWYLKKYPDVAAADVDPLEHYVTHGLAELRSPGPKFNALWYSNFYSDVNESSVPPLVHYIEIGAREGRRPIPSANPSASHGVTIEKNTALTPEEAVSEYWAIDRTHERHSWLQHPTLMDFVHQRVTGDSKVPTYLWLKRKYFPQSVDLCLTLGCGFGGFERGAINLGIAKKFHAHDISSGAIAKAREDAAGAGLGRQIEYFVTDLNQCTLAAETYDAIFIISAAHHIVELENLFAQCRKALKPNGLLFLDEYIGPNRFQSPPLALEVINRILRILPSRYRLNLLTADGSTIDSFVPPPPEVFEQNDPSEAVRSHDILPTLKECFEIVEFRPYGGAILHMLFSGIMGNFDENNETDVALLRSLAIFEDTLEKTGALESDFAAIIARPLSS